MINALYSTMAAALLLFLAGCASPPGCCEPADSLADAKSHFALFGTNRIHYVVEGKGKHAIVLVHCWSGNLGFWREQVPALADKARLILIDLPGHGQSDKPNTAYSMDFFATAVLAVMRDAHVDRAALVAVDGTLRRPKMTLEQAEKVIAQFRAPDYRENTRQFMGTMFPVPGTEAVRDRVVSELLDTPQHVMLGAMQGMFGADQPDWDIRHANVPVLVINAPNPMWNAEYKEYVRSLSPRTEYRAMDGVGHWLMLERPAEFNAALTAMLRKYELIGE